MTTERKALGSALGHAPPGGAFGGAAAGGEGGARTFVGGVLLGDENAALLRQGTQELERQKQVLLMELQGLQENVQQAKATLKKGGVPSALANISGSAASSPGS